MIRRCLSIVAVDIFATETRPLNAVTHGIISSSANGADAGQQTQRAATTLTAIHAQHGFTEIKMLCPELVWDMTAGHVTFNQLPCFDSDLNDAAGRRQLLRRLEASVEAGDAPALADEQWEQARAFERQVADVGAHPRLLASPARGRRTSTCRSTRAGSSSWRRGRCSRAARARSSATWRTCTRT